MPDVAADRGRVGRGRARMHAGSTQAPSSRGARGCRPSGRAPPHVRMQPRMHTCMRPGRPAGRGDASESGRMRFARLPRARTAYPVRHGRGRRNCALSARGETPRCIRAAMHPAWLRCSSVAYSQYTPFSRLVRRAPRRSLCDAGVPPRAVIGRGPPCGPPFPLHTLPTSNACH